MSKDNGGPAFPCSVRRSENYMDEGGYGRVRMVTVQEGGLSLRDYFAAQAISGLMYMVAHGSHGAADSHEGCAKEAYALADAMLAARSK